MNKTASQSWKVFSHEWFEFRGRNNERKASPFSWCVEKARTQIDWPVLTAGRHTVRVNGPLTTKHKGNSSLQGCNCSYHILTLKLSHWPFVPSCHKLTALKLHSNFTLTRKKREKEKMMVVLIGIHNIKNLHLSSSEEKKEEMLSVHSTLFFANDSLKYFSQFGGKKERKKEKKWERMKRKKKTMETITGDVLGF